MIRNYFTTAWRNLFNNKFYSIINLVGLTLGLTAGLLILLWVNNESGYDSFHKNADRIFRMNINLESSGTRFAAPVVQAPIGILGLKEVPGIENSVRVTDHNVYSVIRYKDTALKGNLMVYTDPSLFKIFDYKLLQGNIEDLFPNAYSMVITQSTAKRYFGEADPMGKTLTADNKDNFVVTGVLADFPANGWIKCDMLFSIDLLKKQYTKDGRGDLDDDWGNYAWAVFVQLHPGVSVESIEKKLTSINYSHQPNMKPVDAGSYTLQPIKNLHLYAADGTPTVIKTVRIFSIVAALILAIASINYVNLSTARAVLRSKEVSVRKMIGASRKQLFIQFIIQTALFFTIALILAFGLMFVSMPLYNAVSGIELHFNPLDQTLWKVIGITLLLTLIASSIYPAVLLSSFHPVQALKGKLSWGIGSATFRKALVVGQFAFSIGLIICTVIITRQVNFMREKELGYDKSFVFSVGMDNMLEHYETARTELLGNPAITSITSSDGNILQRNGATLDVDWDGKDPNGSFFIHDLKIDKDFIALFKIQIAAGAGFTGTAADSSHFILNETAVRQAGIKDPIGKSFRWHQQNGTIIGVAKDFHFTTLRQKIEPFVFIYRPAGSQFYVKTSGQNVAQAIKAVEKIWTQYNAGAPFDYTFMDETYARQYQSDERAGTLFLVFTGFAITISCLGLLGLATFTAQKKVKEIGIRKVLGASVSSIAALLSKDFIVLVIISIVIATPVSWFFMQQWMSEFPYQTNIPWWIFALSGMSAVVIALLMISFQSVRAALENPVRSLKSE